MLFVDNQNVTDPRINLAIEEYVLRHVMADVPILLFYVNEPSVIIGRNQNTLEEIDPTYIKEHRIHVVRRLSGGGAVYHDLGNLNFSFVTNGKEDLHNFARFTEPVIQVLRQLGVNAELRGKSDIFADGKKISGNAQYATGSRMFSHGTLLFDTNIGHMLAALNPHQVQIESKAIHSVRNYVTNVRELLPQDCTIQELKQALLQGIFGTGAIPSYPLAESDWQQIRRISESRYQLWDWNYGRSPKFNIQKHQRTPAGKVDLRIDVDEGHIQSVKIYGDFAGKREIAELEKLFVGVRYDPDTLAEFLQGIDLGHFFGGLSQAEFLQLLTV